MWFGSFVSAVMRYTGSRTTVPSACVTATVAYRFSPDDAEPGKNGSIRYLSRFTSKRVPSTYCT